MKGLFSNNSSYLRFTSNSAIDKPCAVGLTIVIDSIFFICFCGFKV